MFNAPVKNILLSQVYVGCQHCVEKKTDDHTQVAVRPSHFNYGLKEANITHSSQTSQRRLGHFAVLKHFS